MLQLLLISACAWVSDEEVTRRFDQDQDGHLWPEDCDDGDRTIFPGAEERCGGGDEDCDDEVDEGYALGASVYYLDLDNDTWGDPFAEVGSCTPVAGYVTRADDCDDSAPERYPGAEEDCDGVDDDCDDQVDEDPVDPAVWYRDDDGDGYGVAESYTESCEPPSGFTDNTLDCDDSSALASPDQAEVCNDGLDNDCDGAAGPCVPDPALGYADLDLHIVGEAGATSVEFGSIARAVDLNGDGQGDLAVAAPGSSVNGGGGAVYVFFGPLEGPVTAADADSVVVGAAGSQLGRGLDVMTDLDGATALLLGAPRASSGEGEALVMPGSALAPGYVSAAGVAVFGGPNTSAGSGTAVLAFTDPNRDGLTDMIVGMPTLNSTSGGYNKSGQLCIYDNVERGDLFYNEAVACIIGDQNQQQTGRVLGALGDMDGNGQDDFAFGNPSFKTNGIVYLGINPTWVWVTPDYFPSLTGESSGDLFGSHIAPAGDVDGDGYDDALISAPESDATATNSGAVYLIPGAALLSPWSGGQTVTLASSARFAGGAASDGMGPATGAGDQDHDGVDDLVIGAPGAEGGAGRVYLIYGPVTGETLLEDAVVQLTGDSPTLQLGASLTLLTDLNGDPHPELWIGAPGLSGDGGASGGGVLLLGVGP